MELYNHQIEHLQQENERARLEISNKMEDYEKKKLVLKSVTPPDVFRRAEDYIESGSPSPFLPWDTHTYSATNHFTSPLASASNANTSMIHQLADLLTGNSTRGLLEAVPSTSTDDTSTRLHVLTTLLDLLRNVPAERNSAGPSEEITRPSASASNGFNRFLNESVSPPASGRGRPYGDGLAGGTARPFSDPGPSGLVVSSARNYAGGSSAGAVAHPYGESGPGGAHAYAEGAGPPRYPPMQAVPPRQYRPGVCEGASVPPNAHSAPPLYMPGAYASTTQPPAPAVRAFYGQFPSNNMPNPPYPGGVGTQPRPPMPPQNAQNNPYFMGGRYPNQHYYPPYQ